MRFIVLFLCLFVVGCGNYDGIRFELVEGVADMESFGGNAQEIVYRLVRKVETVANERDSTKTELAIEQEKETVVVLVKEGKPATEEEEAVPPEFEIRDYVSPEVVGEALEEFNRLRQENSEAAISFMKEWIGIKGDLVLGVERAKAVRATLENLGVRPQDVRGFSDGMVGGLEGITRREEQ